MSKFNLASALGQTNNKNGVEQSVSEYRTILKQAELLGKNDKTLKEKK